MRSGPFAAERAGVQPLPPATEPPGAARASRGVALGLVVILLVVVVDALVGGRTIPLTGVLLGPLLASAVAAPRAVSLVGATALGAAVGLTLYEGLTGAEAWTRVLLVLLAALASTAVSLIRTRHEHALAKADDVAQLSQALQLGLLPTLHGTSRVAVRSIYRPTLHDLVLGGDFMDVVPAPWASDGAVAFCVGDVTGHDAAAASLGAALRAAWRGLAVGGGDPASWLHSLDAVVRVDARDDDKLATLLVGVLEPERRRVALASAGHPDPVLVGDRAQPVDVEAGPPLGLPDGLAARWPVDVVELPERFTLVLYTDGLVEGRRAPGSAARFGDDGLAAWLATESTCGRIDDGALERLVADVEAANGGPLHDDVALMVLTDVPAPVDDEAALRLARLPTVG